MHISEIGKKTGLEEHKAGRILRLLATKHVFREGFCFCISFCTCSSAMYLSVGKHFCKQSAEYPTPLKKPIVQHGACFVGFIYFEISMFLTITTQGLTRPKSQPSFYLKYSPTKHGATHMTQTKQLLTNIQDTQNLCSPFTKR